MSIKKEYNSLSDKEKIKRLEIVAQMYASWLDVENPSLSVLKDCTEHWFEMEAAFNDEVANDS
jgi:hypothetical protein